MIAQAKDRRQPAAGPSDAKLISDEVERELTQLLRANMPDLSAKNTFHMAAGLVDAAAAAIGTLQGRVAVLEAEQAKAKAQETEWESLLTKWRDMALGLKAEIRELEDKLAQANQRTMQAEVRAQNLEEEILYSSQGSVELCNKVISAFGNGTLIDRVSHAARDLAADRASTRDWAGNC